MSEGRVSSFCDRGDCVKVAGVPGGWVRVTDTKDREGVSFTVDEWDAFIRGAKAGEFDLENL